MLSHHTVTLSQYGPVYKERMVAKVATMFEMSCAVLSVVCVSQSMPDDDVGQRWFYEAGAVSGGAGNNTNFDVSVFV